MWTNLIENGARPLFKINLMLWIMSFTFFQDARFTIVKIKMCTFALQVKYVGHQHNYLNKGYDKPMYNKSTVN